MTKILVLVKVLFKQYCYKKQKTTSLGHCHYVADLPLLRTLLTVHQKPCGLSFWEVVMLSKIPDFPILRNNFFFRISVFHIKKENFMILTGETNSQIKLQHLQKVWIWAFGYLVHQSNSLEDVVKLEPNFRKNKVVTGKTRFVMIVHFVLPILFVLTLNFWQSSFVWKCRLFTLSTFD